MAVIVAIIEPILPIIEQEFRMVVRTLDGHSSAVNMYNELNASVIEHFPNMNNNNMIVEFSAGMEGVEIVENAVSMSAKNRNFLRFIKFNSGSEINNPGISIATTNMKLIYRFWPGTCVAIILRP